jgi:hypothetical protein
LAQDALNDLESQIELVELPLSNQQTLELTPSQSTDISRSPKILPVAKLIGIGTIIIIGCSIAIDKITGHKANDVFVLAVQKSKVILKNITGRSTF